MKTILLLSLLGLTQLVHAEDIYRLQTTIGDHVFNDILILDSATKGSVSVPGVFSSPIEEVSLNNNQLNFKVMAHEGSENYYVNYSLKFNKASVTGQLKQDDQVIGEIKGTKIFEGK